MNDSYIVTIIDIEHDAVHIAAEWECVEASDNNTELAKCAAKTISTMVAKIGTVSLVIDIHFCMA